jgi:hypothetical protein
VGAGSSPCSLSHADIRRILSRGLPASRRYSPGKWSFRPRSRADPRIAAAEFRVRLFSSLRLMVAPPAGKPGQDTPVIFFASSPLSTRTATASDRPFASCHGSRLLALRLLFFYRSAVPFSTSPTWWKVFHVPCRGSVSFPDQSSLCPPFGVFR